MNKEMMHTEELADIPEHLTMYIKPTIHPSNLYMSPVILSKAQTPTEVT